jgi:hypothetical protein
VKTIRIQYDEPARSKSRNVNAYTRAEAQRKALRRALDATTAAALTAAGKLNGRQSSEARRLLYETPTTIPMGGAA